MFYTAKASEIIMIMIMIMIMIIIKYLIDVNQSAEAVRNGCPGQLKN